MTNIAYRHLAYLGVAGLLASLGAAPALAQEILRINSFGGVYEETHQRLVIKPFEEANNVRVEVVTLYSADTLAQLRAQKDSPQFDVVHFSGGQEIVAAREGLLVPIKPEELSNYDQLYSFAAQGIEQGIGPAYVVVANGLIYNSEKVENPPATWAEFLAGGFGEEVTLTDLSNTYGLQALLMMNQVAGGTLDNIQPGLDAARKLLDDGAQIVASAPEIQQAFAQGATAIAPYAQEYAYTLRAAGMPVGFIAPTDGSPVSYFTISAVAGRPNSELAKKFIDFSLSAEVQAGWAESMRYSPTNKTAQLPDEVAADVIHGEEAMSQTVRFDPEVVNANRPAWVEAWNRMIAQ
jgi:putative spermidine/putrescine transport system substrate-binding protein